LPDFSSVKGGWRGCGDYRDKVSGLHLDDAIEPWLAERGFSNAHDESFILESA
jgi:hypothetical protein